MTGRKRKLPPPDLLTVSPRPPKPHRIAKADRVGLPSPKLPHIATDESRALVGRLASFGLSGPQVAELVDITLPTLYKHYGKQMRQAGLWKDVEVMESAFLKAVGGPDRDWEKSDAAQQRWWTEIRQRWRKPPEQHVVATVDLTKLSDVELDELERILERASDLGGSEEREGEA